MVMPKILIVEDESLIAMDIESRLSSLGYEVPAVVDNGSEALRIVADIRPDLVMMDIIIKGEMDGVETADVLRCKFDVPVIYLTSHTDKKTMDRANRTQPFGYLPKPFNETMLQTSIETALYKHGMERQLRDSEERIKLLLNSTAEGIFGIDLDGKITFCNNACMQFLGYENDDELAGKDMHELVPHISGNGKSCGRVNCQILNSFIESRKIHLHDHSFQRQDNSQFPVELWSNPIYKDNEITGAVVTFLDISEKKQMMDQLLLARKDLEIQVKNRTQELNDKIKELKASNIMLEDANNHKNRFLSTISHELRTPLTGILGFAQLMENRHKSQMNPKHLHYLKNISKSGNHLLELVSDLLEFVRIDGGDSTVILKKFQPLSKIRAVIDMMGIQIHNKKIVVDLEIADSLSLLTADLRKFKQIILNLLSNAIKYSPEKGRILISGEINGKDTALFKVIDSGIGIKEENLGKIFSEFYQEDRIRDENLGGTGIGLALSKRLVELHGGEIGVKSTLGKGCIFWFTLPIIVGPLEEKKSGVENVFFRPPHLIGRRVLVVDDIDLNRELIIDVLESNGLQFRSAINGREAIEAAKTFIPELILLDLQMPVMNGFDATAQLRLLPEFAEIPIIALTASIDKNTINKAIEVGFTGSLAKPFNVNELNKVINRYLK